MERIVKLGLLYDFYGELLTDHQKRVYEDYVYNDYSVSEIAQEYEVSRQAASDLIKRINKILEDYENKLKLVERFDSIKARIEALDNISAEDKAQILKEL